MTTKQNEPTKAVADKKQWAAPLVEIISTNNIASGPLAASSEGTSQIKSGGGGIISVLYFS